MRVFPPWHGVGSLTSQTYTACMEGSSLTRAQSHTGLLLSTWLLPSPPSKPDSSPLLPPSLTHHLTSPHLPPRCTLLRIACTHCVPAVLEPGRGSQQALSLPALEALHHLSKRMLTYEPAVFLKVGGRSMAG